MSESSIQERVNELSVSCDAERLGKRSLRKLSRDFNISRSASRPALLCFLAIKQLHGRREPAEVRRRYLWHPHRVADERRSALRRVPTPILAGISESKSFDLLPVRDA